MPIKREQVPCSFTSETCVKIDRRIEMLGLASRYAYVQKLVNDDVKFYDGKQPAKKDQIRPFSRRINKNESENRSNLGSDLDNDSSLDEPA